MSKLEQQAVLLDELDSKVRAAYAKRGETITVAALVGSGEAQCADCRDVGWLSFDVPVGDTNFGKVTACHCRTRRQADRMMHAIAGDTTRRYSFQAWRPSLNPIMEPAFVAAVEWATGNAVPWLVVIGPPGCGKSHLALSAVREHVAAGRTAAYYTAGQWLGLQKAAIGDESLREQAGTAYERVMYSQVVVIDDLGMQSDSAYNLERLEEILVHRFQQGAMTMLTMNTPRVSDRVASRFTDKTMCKMVLCNTAKDVRGSL